MIFAQPSTPPDFPVAIAIGAPLTSSPVAASQFASASGFNPIQPPQQFAKELPARPTNYLCGGLIVDDNVAHDRRDGRARGTVQFFAYCSGPIDSGLAFNFDAMAVDLVSLTDIGHKFYHDEPCNDTGQKYNRIWSICKTSAIPVSSISGHAERDFFLFTLLVPNSGPVNSAANATFFINNKGVFYPRIPAQAFWGGVEEGTVPFPDGYLTDCRIPASNCIKGGDNSKALRNNLIKAGFSKPGGPFEAHHIQPLRWGGTNLCDSRQCNGV